MTRMTRRILAAVVAAVLAVSVGTATAATDEEKCLSKRTVAWAKYESCVNNWLAGCYGRGDCGDIARLSHCREKYTATWAKLAALTDSETCKKDRFVGNTDGTVSDNLTGLVWEKKTEDDTIRDVSQTYAFSDSTPGLENGSLFSIHLLGLNGAGFAESKGWRLPTLAELMTLLNQPYPCATSPCVDEVFEPTEPYLYWTSTTYQTDPTLAYVVKFRDGIAHPGTKTVTYSVRAVRGGL